jgi:hypothetical protein
MVPAFAGACVSSAGGAVSPGGEDFVGGGCGDGGLGGGEEFAADEPGYGGLGGAFGDADGFGQLLIADGDGGGATLLLCREPDVHEEAGGAPVVADKIAEEDVGDVGVELEHGCTDRRYSNN